ncbi:MAG: penicillin-binding transpeptidase domain-containing protein [Beijerinckiaceae bacterium]
MPTFTRRGAALSFAALAAPLLNRTARSQAPADWRLSKETDWPDFARRFEEIGTSGTFVMLDARLGGRLVAHPGRAQTGYLPSSTFKIPNTLLALHLGAVRDLDEEAFRWNGQRFVLDGKPALPPACDADVSLRVAFRNSCIPVYQEIARRIGAEAYREWLIKLDYGNAEIGGAPLDEFWMKGDLRVSADQQAKFLRKLVIKTLPVTPRATSLTEEIMFIEKIGDTSIHGKGGLAVAEKPAVGWWVGYAQRNESLVLLALNLDMKSEAHGEARYGLVKEALRQTGLLA